MIKQNLYKSSSALAWYLLFSHFSSDFHHFGWPPEFQFNLFNLIIQGGEDGTNIIGFILCRFYIKYRHKLSYYSNSRPPTPLQNIALILSLPFVCLGSKLCIRIVLGRFVHGDMYPSNICPGNICQTFLIMFLRILDPEVIWNKFF